MSWNMFNEEEDDDVIHFTSKEGDDDSQLQGQNDDPINIWDNGRIPVPTQSCSFSRNVIKDPMVSFGGKMFSHSATVNPGSAPMPQTDMNGMFDTNDVTFQGVIELDEQPQQQKMYYLVQFSQFHKDIFCAKITTPLKQGEYVLTEADRGFDIGRITVVVQRPSAREIQNAKKILRLATQHEVAQLSQKYAREAKALQIGRAKVSEFQLPMSLTGAEFQFDGNKLTFYYQASSYIDFRNLVRALFKIFQIRIWMQAAPVI